MGKKHDSQYANFGWLQHSSTYWNNSIDYQWLFFKKFFDGYRNNGE